MRITKANINRDNGEWKCIVEGNNPETGGLEEVEGSINLFILPGEYKPESEIKIVSKTEKIMARKWDPAQLLCTADVEVLLCFINPPFPGQYDMTAKGEM